MINYYQIYDKVPSRFRSSLTVQFWLYGLGALFTLNGVYAPPRVWPSVAPPCWSARPLRGTDAVQSTAYRRGQLDPHRLPPPVRRNRQVWKSFISV